jgi:predicted Zn-dependent protease
MIKNVKEQMSVAVELKEAGQLQAAEEILARLNREDPESATILAVLGDVYWDLGRLSDAVITFSRATRLSPTLEAVSLGLFHCLWKLGRQDEAMEEIKRFQTISDSQDYRDIIEEINKEG